MRRNSSPLISASRFDGIICAFGEGGGDVTRQHFYAPYWGRIGTCSSAAQDLRYIVATCLGAAVGVRRSVLSKQTSSLSQAVCTRSLQLPGSGFTCGLSWSGLLVTTCIKLVVAGYWEVAILTQFVFLRGGRTDLGEGPPPPRLCVYPQWRERA